MRERRSPAPRHRFWTTGSPDGRERATLMTTRHCCTGGPMEPHSSASDQAFLEELRRHRAELREAMSALEDALAAPVTADPARWAQRVNVALVELSGDFREHIEVTEGRNGLYRELLRTSPRLSDAVAGLTREHVLICGQVDACWSEWQHRTSSRTWTESAAWARRSSAGSSDTGSEAPISSSRPTSSTSGARPDLLRPRASPGRAAEASGPDLRTVHGEREYHHDVHRDHDRAEQGVLRHEGEVRHGARERHEHTDGACPDLTAEDAQAGDDQDDSADDLPPPPGGVARGQDEAG